MARRRRSRNPLPRSRPNVLGVLVGPAVKQLIRSALAVDTEHQVSEWVEGVAVAAMLSNKHLRSNA